MSVLRRGFLFSAIAAALAASPASGAWTAPATISAPHAFIGGFYGENVVLASGSAGVLAAWPFEDGFAPHAVTGASEAMAPPGGRFGAERHLPRAYASGPMVAMGGGRVVQLILAPAGTNQSSMAIAIGDVSGRFGRSIAVPGRAFGQRVSVAGNARGDVLVSWIAADSHGQHSSAWASVRFAGGRFANPVRLAAGLRTERVWAAIGRGRRMVVAFDGRVGALFARVRNGGGAWSRMSRLGPAAVGTENDVTAFVGDFGEVVVAWYHTQLCAGGCESPGDTDVAVEPADSNRFVAPRLLERDPHGLAGAPSGRSLAPVVISVPWSTPVIAFIAAGSAPAPAPVPSPAVVRVAYPTGAGWGPRGGGYTPPRAVSSADGHARDLAGAAGRVGVLLTWVDAEPPYWVEGTLFAATTGQRLPSPFGAPEQVSYGERVLGATPVFNPATRWPGGGQVPPWTLAWTERNVVGTARETVVRASSPVCPPDPICF